MVDRQSGSARSARSAPPELHELEPPKLLAIEGLVKIFRDPMSLRPFTAVAGVSLTLERGEIFGLLGPNGAGKTTTIKMILGLVHPSHGAVHLEGLEPGNPKARRRLGYLPENPCFYDHLTPAEYLELVGTLFGIERGLKRRRAGALLERLGLSAHARTPLRKFSKGMTQRLGLAQALLNEPRLLILDEPMSGLDPIGRAEVKALLREERARGATVLMSSHVLAETETICDRIGIMNHGRLLEVGPVPRLLSTGIKEWEVSVDTLTASVAAWVRSTGSPVESAGARTVVRVADAGRLQEFLRRLAEASVSVYAVEPRRETLEEHFVRALGANREEPS